MRAPDQNLQTPPSNGTTAQTHTHRVMLNRKNCHVLILVQFCTFIVIILYYHLKQENLMQTAFSSIWRISFRQPDQMFQFRCAAQSTKLQG